MKKMAAPNNPMIPVAITVAGDTLALLYASPLATKTKLFLSTGTTGVYFSMAHEVHVLTTEGRSEPLTHCEDFHITHDGTTHYLSYARTVRNKKERVIASSTDLTTFHVISRTTAVPDPLAVVPDHAYKESFVAYAGERSIRAAVTKDFEQWHVTSPILEPRGDHFDSVSLRVTGALAIDRGILVTYDATDYDNAPNHIMLGAALFAYDQPYKVTWRSPFPVWETDLKKDDAPATSLGSVSFDGQIHNYWMTRQQKVVSVALPLSVFGPQAVESATLLERHPENPIITPNACNRWECEATFNPAAIYLDGKVHLLYRAIGSNGMSYIGYASSEDGLHFTERLDEPAYVAQDHYTKLSAKKEPYVNTYMSGGSWSGCEDPRVVKVDDTLYMTYTSFDGYHPPGMSLTSISVPDFLAKRWNWTDPILISKPEQIQKNWVMFPEKINGKYAILHSINPKVRIDYFNTIEDAEMAIESPFSNKGDANRWDNHMRGAATPPLMTKEGWLVFYHAMDKRDPNRYKLGAMLLDANDPTIIRYRSDEPILEPNESYENDGAKAGVVFACGSIVKDDAIYVYYGGADSVVCVATSPLDALLEAIKREPQQIEELPLKTATVTITKS